MNIRELIERLAQLESLYGSNVECMVGDGEGDLMALEVAEVRREPSAVLGDDADVLVLE